MAVECINHEYYLRFSDRILALIRKIFHNYPEFRHDSFKHVARFAPFIPFMGGRPDLRKPLKRVITFSDHSNSLYFGCPIILAAGANNLSYVKHFILNIFPYSLIWCKVIRFCCGQINTRLCAKKNLHPLP